MISVLLPTFNSSQTLGLAIENILSQTLKEIELVILDDGSSDNTEDVVSQRKDGRIRFFKLSHQGLAETLNYGLSVARYDIIARMDADDLCAQHRLEVQLRKLSALSANHFVSCWSAVFKDRHLSFIIKTPTASAEIKKGLLLHSYISHSGLMFYKDTLRRLGGYTTSNKEKAFEDYETWLRIKDQVEFYNIPEVMMFHRYSPTSLSNNLLYKQKVMYRIQQPYYDNLHGHFDIATKDEEYYYRGWREYFFGDRRRARAFWRKLGLKIIMYPRVCVAWCVSYFPLALFVDFNEIHLKYRAQYLLHYYSKETRSIRKTFASLAGKLDR